MRSSSALGGYEIIDRFGGCGSNISIWKLQGYQGVDSPSGTGPRVREPEGMIARVMEIMSKTLAIDDRVRRTFPKEGVVELLFSETAAPFLVVCAKRSIDSWVMWLRDLAPGSRIRIVAKVSTSTTMRTAAPTRIPPSVHCFLESTTRPKRRG